MFWTTSSGDKNPQLIHHQLCKSGRADSASVALSLNLSWSQSTQLKKAPMEQGGYHGVCRELAHKETWHRLSWLVACLWVHYDQGYWCPCCSFLPCGGGGREWSAIPRRSRCPSPDEAILYLYATWDSGSLWSSPPALAFFR
uniref:cDNA FLJ25883 fis, clone CBR02735 n=1 Tax=Homo sapiens TaxID=9606 RepID=Q8N796_HUMAN|nr:unnamed protein product [Homo sapiens]